MRIIDLTRTDAERFENADKVLQNEAFNTIRNLISMQLNRLTNEPYQPASGSDLSYRRRHNAILVQGKRGSGKTTFLLNALHELKEGIQDWSKEFRGKIHVLPMIDPTLIETKEHIIIVIISLIDAALDEKSGDTTKVDLAREAMAEGLGLLDGIGTASPYGAEWEDPAWIMSRGLRKAGKGRHFEMRLAKYIDEALKFLGKSAFALAFDDVDTNFQHGHTILETIRKYLTSPQLILMISGDLDLYGRLVRRSIYDNFGENLIKNDLNILHNEKPHLSAEVMELEEQYLLKIVPPQNRISMLPLSTILKISPDNDVQVISTTHPEHLQPLVPWASHKIREQMLEGYSSGSRGLTQSHPFFDFVSKEHLRLLIGYLSALDNEDLAISRQAVLKVFETRLRSAGIAAEDLGSADPNELLRIIFKWLINQNNTTSLLRFNMPASAEQTIATHCFSISLAQSLQQYPAEALRVLFTLTLPIALMQHPNLSSTEMKESIFNFIWTDSTPTLAEVSARIGSIYRSASISQGNQIGVLSASSFGSVGILREIKPHVMYKRLLGISDADIPRKAISILEMSYLLKEKNINNASVQWIDLLSKESRFNNLLTQKGVCWFPIEDLEKRCGQFGRILRLITYDRYNYRGERLRSISALSLLGCIGDLLLEEDISSIENFSFSSAIPAFILNSDNTSTVSVYDTENQYIENDNIEDNVLEIEVDNDNDFYFSSFIAELKEWHVFSKKIINLETISPTVLTNLAERIHDDLIKLDSEVSMSWKTGEILHRQITNILHAIITVTSLNGDNFRRKEAPKKSDRVLGETLERITESKSHELHPLAIVIISCPLIWMFLNQNEEYKLSGSRSDRLIDKFSSAIFEWNSKLNRNNIFSSNWLMPTTIEMEIGRSKNTININGFYDALNVVPRYYPNS